MNQELLVAAVGAVACLLVVLVGWKLDAWRNRSSLAAAVTAALGYRAALIAGIVAALAYLVVFFVWGGKNGRVHLFYGHWILNFNTVDVVVAAVTALLMGLTVTLLVQTVKQVGMFKNAGGGVGVAGTLLAVAASFCP
jgi:hypothetical protein